MARNWNVEGFKNVSYTSRKTGKQVEGTTLFLSSQPVTPDVEGAEVKEIYLPRSASAYRPVLGDTVNIFYNERGYVDDVVSINK